MKRIVISMCAVTVVLGAAGCASRPAWVRASLESATPEFQKEFKLVETRCSQCHKLDKLRKLYNPTTSRDDWNLEVMAMADEEGSKIRESEIEPLTDLLFAWSQMAE
jgi:uncharacterized membrane protein